MKEASAAERRMTVPLTHTHTHTGHCVQSRAVLVSAPVDQREKGNDSYPRSDNCSHRDAALSQNAHSLTITTSATSSSLEKKALNTSVAPTSAQHSFSPNCLLPDYSKEVGISIMWFIFRVPAKSCPPKNIAVIFLTVTTTSLPFLYLSLCPYTLAPG